MLLTFKQLSLFLSKEGLHHQWRSLRPKATISPQHTKGTFESWGGTLTWEGSLRMQKPCAAYIQAAVTFSVKRRTASSVAVIETKSHHFTTTHQRDIRKLGGYIDLGGELENAETMCCLHSSSCHFFCQKKDCIISGGH